MEKGFSNLISDPKKLNKVLVCGGILLTAALGIKSYQSTRLTEPYKLPRNEAGKGSYEENLIARIEGQEEIFMTLTVEEQIYTEEEAEEILQTAAAALETLVQGENESLENITKRICFADSIPETCVEVTWTEKALEYFESDGSLRQEADVSEPVRVKISAILSCREYTKDFETILTIQPAASDQKQILTEMVKENALKSREETVLTLPRTYEGKEIRWTKPMDKTFIYILPLMLSVLLFLKIGRKRDEKKERQKRAEALEKDYAQVVSKFTMLLSAGLSVRNAWERIVRLYRRNPSRERLVYEQMSIALGKMEKGISEIEVYESFGVQAGEVHYKKLMSLFISDKRRGSRNLLEAMNQEMLSAWEERKRKTRQQGETIGTKLLFPMMGMLAIVFFMVLVPAFLSFNL